MTPRIDSVLDRFRQRGALSSETDAAEERRTEEPVMILIIVLVLILAFKNISISGTGSRKSTESVGLA